MPEKASQYSSAEEIEQDAFLLAELNYRDAYVLDPVGALEQWFEFIAERRIRGMSAQEVDEMSWCAQDRADRFDFAKELTIVE